MEDLKHSFESLEAWKLARNLSKEISMIVKTFPKHEKFSLTDQMVRASRSVSSNIAEGYGRFHYQENLQFCRQARGSLFELKNHIITASDEKYLDQKSYDFLNSMILNNIKVLNGYIKYIKTEKQMRKEK